VLAGIFVSVTLELCGTHSLSFAVGAYLPIATTAPIFAGGLVRWYVQKRTGRIDEGDIGAGTLFSSGLIAGGSLTGILFAILVGTGTIAPLQGLSGLLPFLREGVSGQLATAMLFLALMMILARSAQRRVEA
jgi:hypothetical protein